MLLSEQLYEPVLRLVRVLVLVDEDKREAISVSLEQVRVVLEQLDGLHEEVVEVEGILVFQRLLIFRKHLPYVA